MKNRKELEEKKILNKLVLFPIHIPIFFLMITIILFVWGPIEWAVDNKIMTFIYVTMNYFFLFLGYKLYMNSKRKNRIKNSNLQKFEYNEKVRFIFLLTSLFSIIAHIIYSYFTYGGINLSNFTQMGSVYLEGQEIEAENNILTRFLTYGWGIIAFYLPIGILFFRKMPKSDKFVFFLSLIVNIAFWLSIGTVKGLGDIFIVSIVPIIYVVYSTKYLNTQHLSIKKKTSTKKIIIIGVLFLIAFGTIQDDRAEERGRTVYTSENALTRSFIVEEDVWIFPAMTNGIIFYVSHGYTGLSYGLKLPFEWTYGFGSSRALNDIADRNFNFSVEQNTYPSRVDHQYGWDNGGIWPTNFTWLASDFSFWGVPLLLFIVGRVYAYTYYIFVKEKSIIGLIACSQILIFLFYLPANNQLLQSERAFYSTALIFSLLFIDWFRRRVRWK